ncbi:TetR/AcrR family transcriptional regulator [Millionella massiliensis]|uniref:TetR/AcrR family transcriptional regulator n=1 Tax=Millionella massiliensis TaxID=1871023 RepID=UPI0008DA7454|nr:TetR/AcrR family transcriptional regulator [Millionella massiliensis]
MKTNREEILQNALRLFMSMNYERVSLQMITRKVGLTKTGIFNYYPTKQDLFVAVADRFLFVAQDPQKKYDDSDGTLADYLEKYVQGVKRTMAEIVRLGNFDIETMPGRSANAGYFHFIQQVLAYYPDSKTKIDQLFATEYDHWRRVVSRAVESGEISSDTDVDEAVALFRQVFVGLSFEMSFFTGLDTEQLGRRFRYIYGLLKR